MSRSLATWTTAYAPPRLKAAEGADLECPNRMAVIAGSTGAVGRQRMDLLIASPRFEKILVLHHRPTPYSGQGKVKQLVVDFAAFPAQPQEMSLQGPLRKYRAVHGKTVARGMLPSRNDFSAILNHAQQWLSGNPGKRKRH